MTVRIDRIRLVLPAGTAHPSIVARRAARGLLRPGPAVPAGPDRSGALRITLAAGAPPGVAAARVARALRAAVAGAKGGRP